MSDFFDSSFSWDVNSIQGMDIELLSGLPETYNDAIDLMDVASMDVASAYTANKPTASPEPSNQCTEVPTQSASHSVPSVTACEMSANTNPDGVQSSNALLYQMGFVFPGDQNKDAQQSTTEFFFSNQNLKQTEQAKQPESNQKSDTTAEDDDMRSLFEEHTGQEAK